jgi:hypothetical protein
MEWRSYRLGYHVCGENQQYRLDRDPVLVGGEGRVVNEGKEQDKAGEESGVWAAIPVGEPQPGKSQQAAEQIKRVAESGKGRVATRGERRPSPEVDGAPEAKDDETARVLADEVDGFAGLYVDELSFAEVDEVLELATSERGVSGWKRLAFAPLAVPGTKFGAKVVANERRALEGQAVANDPWRDNDGED